MKGQTVYLQVAVQMFMRGIDRKTLAEKTGITYTSLIRKLRDESPITLQEAMKIKKALGTDMALEELFARRENEEIP